MCTDVHAVLLRANNNNNNIGSGLCPARRGFLRCCRCSLPLAVAMVTSALLGVFTVARFLVKGRQVHTEPGARWTTLPMCLRVAAESQSGMSSS